MKNGRGEGAQIRTRHQPPLRMYSLSISRRDLTHPLPRTKPRKTAPCVEQCQTRTSTGNSTCFFFAFPCHILVPPASLVLLEPKKCWARRELREWKWRE